MLLPDDLGLNAIHLDTSGDYVTTDRNSDRSTHADSGLPVDLWLERSGARAALTPSEGFCCTAWRVLRDERWVGLLSEAPSWEPFRGRPAFYGNPILFPYPYSIHEGAFVYKGKRYTRRPGREGNYIHGLTRDHPWTLEETWADADGAHARASITVGGGDPVSDDLLAEYPFPFRLRVTYTLTDASLLSEYEVTNIGPETIPFGLGIHPYFPVPLLPGGGLEDLVMRANGAYVRTMRSFEAGFLPVPPELDIRDGQRLDAHLAAATIDGRPLLSLYSTRPEDDAADGAGGGVCWSVQETRSGLTVTITSEDAFAYLGNYAPPERHILSPVVSTCAPGALNALERGRTEGIVELEPGATWRSWTRMAAEWA